MGDDVDKSCGDKGETEMGDDGELGWGMIENR